MKNTILSMLLIAASVQLYSQNQEEEIIGISTYDLQSNAACQNRIYLYDDGTIGATWTFSTELYTSYPDRGTGYNYFDGTAWGEDPTQRIESDRTGWPSYAPWGETGEIILSHYSGADTIGLNFCTRAQKGTGIWTEHIFNGPAGQEELLWPRMVTGGTDNNTIYLLALTLPIYYGGTTYQGIDGALLYSRSSDGGESWDHWNEILPGMDSSQYKHFNFDSYTWAEPRGNTVAFVTGSYDHDLFLMKSTDGGDNFDKTIIWDHPFDQGYQTIPADTFYCTDGNVAAAIDANGKVHVAFGITKTAYMTMGAPGYYQGFKDVDGLAYWNEDMPAFSSDLNALNPTDHPNSELVKDYNLIGWMQDVNGDSTISLLDEWGQYPTNGMSAMPQIIIDDNNRVFVIYTSVTETYDNGAQNYRRLWMRASLDDGSTWGPFYHYIADNPNQIFWEFSYPSAAANSDENIYLLCQTDPEPGLDIYGEMGGDHNFLFITIPKDFIVGIDKNPARSEGFRVLPSIPNPCSEQTTIRVQLDFPAPLLLSIFNLIGTKLTEQYIPNGQAGLNEITLDTKGFTSGTYFYTVQARDKTITGKMMVR